MIYRKTIGLLLALSLNTTFAQAQEADLINILDSISPKEVQYTFATFKSTRVLNGHSNERMPEGQLDLRVGHRFGLINQGYYQFFGLDQGTTFLALEYGFTDWVMVGVNRATADKTTTGFAKFSLLRQCSGARVMPVSVSLLMETSIDGMKWIFPERNNLFSSRVSYATQLIVARKVNDNISVLLSPIWIHRNLVPTIADHNDMFALGMGGRYKLSRRISFNAEYYPVISPSWNAHTAYTNSFSLGFDIETGGHVFQLLLSNSTGMNEKAFVSETSGQWLKGDLHLGFNISRVFALKRKKL